MNFEKQTRKTDQQINLKIFYPFGEKHVLTMLWQVRSANTRLRTHVFEWQKRFKERCRYMKADFRSRRPSTSRSEVNIERVWQMVCGDCRLTVQMIASQLDMKKDSAWKIIPEDLGMWKVSVSKNGTKTV